MNREADTVETEEGLADTNMRVARISGGTAPANSFDAVAIRINHYANTSNHKVVLTQSSLNQENTTGNIRAIIASGWWRDTATITSITLLPLTGPKLDAGSRFDLYGIQGGE